MKFQEIFQYLKVLKKWWWVVALLVMTTIGTMLAIMFISEPTYEAQTTVQVSAPPPQEVPLFSQFGREALQVAIKQTQEGFSEFLIGGSTAWLAVKTVPETSMSGRELRDQILVDIPKDSQLMKISVVAPEAEIAAKLANAVVEIGLDQYGLLLAQPTANTRSFIDLQLESVREELRAAEAELIQFQINNTVSDLRRAVDRQYDMIRTLKLEVDKKRASGSIEEVKVFEEIILEREAELQDLLGISAQYYELDDRLDRARNTYTFLLDRQSDAEIKENQILELGSIQIITRADPPEKAISVISPKIIFLGGGVSFVIGILLTFLLEYLEMSGTFRDFRRETKPKQGEVAVLSDNIS